MLSKISILTVSVTNASEKSILEFVFEKLSKKDEPFYIVTPNPEIIMLAEKNVSFRHILNNALIASTDGVGILIAAKLLGKQLQARVTGIDLLESLCKESVNESKSDVRKPITVGFLGARKKVAEKTAECLKVKYPGLRVAFAADEWPGHSISCRHGGKSEEIVRYQDTKRQSDQKKDSPNILVSQYPHIDILFVAFGAPKQEQWIAAHIHELPVTAMMAVGGAFDYISGEVVRAPFFVRAIGMEWFFRLIRQPWRFKRQLILGSFLLRVLKERRQKL